MVSDAEYITTSTINRNTNQYKWCTSYNNGNGACAYHWKIVHGEQKEMQYKNKSVHFSDPATNAVIYFSYLLATSDKYVKE